MTVFVMLSSLEVVIIEVPDGIVYVVIEYNDRDARLKGVFLTNAAAASLARTLGAASAYNQYKVEASYITDQRQWR